MKINSGFAPLKKFDNKNIPLTSTLLFFNFFQLVECNLLVQIQMYSNIFSFVHAICDAVIISSEFL